MVVDPEWWIAPMVEAEVSLITVHVESGNHALRALEMVAELSDGKQTVERGLGINPGTPVEMLRPFLHIVDLVLVLGINPGWRQPMLSGTPKRFAEVKRAVGGADRPVRVGLDGGITLDHIDLLAQMQPDFVVSGSAVFGTGSIEENVELLRRHG